MSRASQAARAIVLAKHRPEREGLAELAQQAYQKYQREKQAAISYGRLEEASALRAKPEVAQAYDSANRETERARSLLGALPGGVLGQAIAGEQAGSSERVAQNRAKAESNLAERLQAAANEPAYGQQRAAAGLAQELSAIQGKTAKSYSSEGADLAAEIAKFEADERKEAAEERRSKRTQEGADRRQREKEAGQTKRERERLARGEPATGSKGGGRGGLPKGYNTPDKHTQFRNEVEDVRGEAWHLLAEHPGKNAWERRRYVQKLLEESTPATSGETPDGKKFSVKEKAAVKNQPLLQAALDLALWGRLQKSTVKLLHKAKYSVKQLGYPVGK